jgi:hypothetical protein
MDACDAIISSFSGSLPWLAASAQRHWDRRRPLGEKALAAIVRVSLSAGFFGERLQCTSLVTQEIRLSETQIRRLETTFTLAYLP